MKIRPLVTFGGLLWLALLASLVSCTIVRNDRKDAAAASAPSSAHAGEFDPVAFVEKNWINRVLPEISANATELGTLLAALRADPDAARGKYGRRQEDSAPYVFFVKGRFKVEAANLESSASTLQLDAVAPIQGGSVLVQIGPVIMSSSLRDGLSFIHFGDFTNQVDYANLARALNSRVKEQVVNALDREHLVGTTITFVGAFAEDPSGDVLITPAQLEVVK